MAVELSARIAALVQSRETKKRDLRGIYMDFEAMNDIVAELANAFKGQADYILVPDSFGMIPASMLAKELGIGILPLKNRGGDFVDADDDVRAPYINHCDKPRILMTRSGQVPKGSRLLLVDDWVETAATMQACILIAEELECKVVGIAAIGADKNETTAKCIESGMLKAIVIK